MSCYAVIREAGPGWADGGIAAQPDVADHAAFMNDLSDEGFVVFAGPLAGTDNGRLRAQGSSARRWRISSPWAAFTISRARADRLAITSVEPWNLIVGAERLPHSAPA
jgi:hypothetical protein